MKVMSLIPFGIMAFGIMLSSSFVSEPGLFSPRFLVLYSGVMLGCLSSVVLIVKRAFPLSLETATMLTVGYMVLLPMAKLCFDQ